MKICLDRKDLDGIVRLYIWEKDGLEIKTFTREWENEKQLHTERYLNVIGKGLKEATNWDDRKIEKYLKKFLELYF